MAEVTLDRLAEGIRRANAKGDTEAVKKLGAAYRALQGKSAAQPGEADTLNPYTEGNAVQLKGKVEDLPSRQKGPVTPIDATVATVNGAVAAVPFLQNFTDALGGTVAQVASGDLGPILTPDKHKDSTAYRDWVQHQRDVRAETAERAPLARIAGEVGGNLAGIVALGGTNLGGQALGMTGKFGPRLVNSALSSGAISTAGALSDGKSGGDALKAGAVGAGLGLAGPLIGSALGLGARAVGNKVAPIVNAIRNPAEEGARRFGLAIARDLEANPISVMSAADEAAARANGVPIINADRGGETVRALARSVANQNPEARGVIEKAASDRFSGQAGRAVEFVRRIAGGAVDDLGYQKTIQDAAREVNAPRYKAAFEAPQAKAVWSPEIRQLMQSDTFRSVINAAESRGTDKAAISGFKAVQNPFTFTDGVVGLRTMPDGSKALPSLAFWNQVKIGLDGLIGTAQRSGDKALASDLVAMKSILVKSLDKQVPEYAAARAGAASYFGAEDALDAGKAFANQTRQVPEAKAAFGDMKPAEQAAFRTGFASELIDKIKDARFRANVIDQAFGSPAKREMMELVFGAQKARELEAYVRVEELADKLRGALGNSTTARQLVELGIGAGSGAVLSGGDWKGALGGAALARGGRALGQRIDAAVMQEVARLLTSGSQEAVTKAAELAAKDPKWMVALRSLEQAAGSGARAAIPIAGPALAVEQN